MRSLVQKVNYASVTVDGKIISKIKRGLLVFVGFTEGDNSEKIDYSVRKICNLRIFEDDNNIMNRSVLDEKGEILCISQFTLYGDVKKGNRPSYIKALPGDRASKLYDEFCDKLNGVVPTYKGIFGADMKIELLNDGPTTIWVDTD